MIVDEHPINYSSLPSCPVQLARFKRSTDKFQKIRSRRKRKKRLSFLFRLYHPMCIRVNIRNRNFLQLFWSKWQRTDGRRDCREQKRERRAFVSSGEPETARQIRNNMTDSRCVCPRCLHPSCPLPYAEPPYDEISHEIDSNFISVKVPKNRGKFEPESIERQEDRLSFDFNCADSQGKGCFLPLFS